MIYAYDISKFVRELKAAGKSARALLNDHGAHMEPWMMHRTERIREDCEEAARTFEEHCKEVAK